MNRISYIHAPFFSAYPKYIHDEVEHIITTAKNRTIPCTTHRGHQSICIEKKKRKIHLFTQKLGMRGMRRIKIVESLQ
jgi:hypothetical protein